MSTRTVLLVLSLSLPLSGCATFGIYERIGMSYERALDKLFPSKQAQPSLEAPTLPAATSPPAAQEPVTSEEFNRRALERNPALRQFDEEAKRQREEIQRREEQARREREEEERQKAEQIAQMDKRIDRFMSWVFDLGMALVLYALSSDGNL